MCDSLARKIPGLLAQKTQHLGSIADRVRWGLACTSSPPDVSNLIPPPPPPLETQPLNTNVAFKVGPRAGPQPSLSSDQRQNPPSKRNTGPREVITIDDEYTWDDCANTIASLRNVRESCSEPKRKKRRFMRDEVVNRQTALEHENNVVIQENLRLKTKVANEEKHHQYWKTECELLRIEERHLHDKVMVWTRQSCNWERLYLSEKTTFANFQKVSKNRVENLEAKILKLEEIVEGCPLISQKKRGPYKKISELRSKKSKKQRELEMTGKINRMIAEELAKNGYMTTPTPEEHAKEHIDFRG